MNNNSPYLLDKREIEKILLIRLDKIGDVILTTPVIKNIRRNFPHSKIVFCLTEYTKDVISENPDIDEIIIYPQNKTHKEYNLFYQTLKKEKFDMVLVFSPITKAYLLAYKTHAKIRAGFVYSERPLTKFISHILLNKVIEKDIQCAIKKGDKIAHETEQAIEVLSFLGMAIYTHDLDIKITNVDEIAIENFLKENKINKPLIGVHLSSNWFSYANWDESQFIELLDEIKQNFLDFEIIITYGEPELSILNNLKDRLTNMGIFTFGNQGFKKWAALIKKCSILLTTDTGATHVASAVNTPTVVVYRKDTFNICSQQWHPLKVNYKNIIMEEFNKTKVNIIDSIKELKGKLTLKEILKEENELSKKNFI